MKMQNTGGTPNTSVGGMNNNPIQTGAGLNGMRGSGPMGPGPMGPGPMQ